MPPSLESVSLYTKILTAMVLLLNIGLLLAVRMALKYARRTSELDTTPQGVKMWAGARKAIGVLILAVVVMNGLAVYANHRMVTATQEIALELPHNSDAEYVLGVTP